MLTTTLRSIRAHLRRHVSTGLAVVLGVGFLAATLMIGDSMRSSFGDSFEEANSGLAATVRSAVSLGTEDMARQQGTVDVALADRIAALEGVTDVVPVVDGTAQIVGADGDALGGGGPPTIAGTWIDVDALNPYRVAEGRPPAADDEVVIDRGSAKAGDLAVGDVTTLRTPEVIQVRIVGIATFGEEDSFGPATYAALTAERAQELFVGRPGKVSELRIAAADGVDPDDLADRIEVLLPPDAEVLTADELTADQLAEVEGDFIGFFETMLLGFAVIALLVATFSIHNTFSILVAQRTRHSALLRAVGASRAQVVGAVTLDALFVGVVASLLGLVAGRGLASLAFAGMEAAGFGLGDGVGIQATTVVTSLVVGIGVTLASCLAPALSASRVPPLAAIRETAIEDTGASKLRVGLGTLLLVASAGALVASATGAAGGVATAALGGAGVLVAAVMLGPVIAGPVASALGWPVAAVRGQLGVLARRNAVRNPRRTSGTASALTIGVAIVALFTVFASTITTSIDDVVGESFGGDLVVSVDFGVAELPASLADDVEALDEIDAAVGAGVGVLAVAGTEGDVIYPTVTEPARLDGLIDLDVERGSMADVGADGIAIGSRLAEERGWDVGDQLAFETADGSREVLRVGAVYRTTEVFGEALVHDDVWAAHTAQPSDVAVLLAVAEGVGIDDARAAVTAVTDSYGAPAPLDRDEYVEMVAGQVNQVLGIVYGLLAVAVLIALMGIGNTMSLAVHERTREIGMLRAVGQSRSQVRSMLRWESVIVATFGTVSGVVLGVLVGWGVLAAIGEAEDVVMPLTLPIVPLAVIVGIGALAGVLAGWRPARRAARRDVLTAMSL